MSRPELFRDAALIDDRSFDATTTTTTTDVEEEDEDDSTFRGLQDDEDVDRVKATHYSANETFAFDPFGP